MLERKMLRNHCRLLDYQCFRANQYLSLEISTVCNCKEMHLLIEIFSEVYGL